MVEYRPNKLFLTEIFDRAHVKVSHDPAFPVYFKPCELGLSNARRRVDIHLRALVCGLHDLIHIINEFAQASFVGELGVDFGGEEYVVVS